MNKLQAEDENAIIFDARNYYYIGSFMDAINTVQPKQTTGSADLLAYSYYSYIALQSNRMIRADIKPDNQTALLAFRHLDDYLEKPEQRSEIVKIFNEKLQHDTGETNIWLVTAAIVYCLEGTYDEAIKALHESTDLECMAISVYCLLKINRPDVATQVLKKMQEKSDDATLTQLAQAWIAIYQGGDGLQEAYHIYQEFIDKYSATPLLLNAQAACLIGQGKYEDAEDLLKDALAKRHNDYDTLVNLYVLSHLMGKGSDALHRYYEQIKQFHANSDFIKESEKKAEEFDKLCQHYKPSKNLDDI